MTPRSDSDAPPRRPATPNLSYLSILREITSVGITQVELAQAVGAGQRSVQNWMSGQNAPRGKNSSRLLDLGTVVSLLKDSYTDEGIEIWLHSRNRNLDLQRPIDLLKDGRLEEVLEEARWVAGGM